MVQYLPFSSLSPQRTAPRMSSFGPEVGRPIRMMNHPDFCGRGAGILCRVHCGIQESPITGTTRTMSTCWYGGWMSASMMIEGRPATEWSVRSVTELYQLRINIQHVGSLALLHKKKLNNKLWKTTWLNSWISAVRIMFIMSYFIL